jgi:hypothetical protein
MLQNKSFKKIIKIITLLNFLCPTEEMIGMEEAISLTVDTQGKIEALRNHIVIDLTVTMATTTAINI